MKTSKQVRVTGLGPEVWEALYEISRKENNTVSRIIANLILDYVNKYGSDK